ncbi:MAG: GNAT family N-acetyltransferase, partial [candidate division WOR-3 bacterium]|nr:GNAT family N-acetyltransferase [candidate division WOR-3 bacterium]
MNEIMEIRKVIEEDFTQIRAIASRMWEGNDYLPGVFDEWLADGGFYALTIDDTVVGVTKITLLPCNVIWLEGLRMDPDYQGRGLGEKLAQFAFEKAVGLVNA